LTPRALNGITPPILTKFMRKQFESEIPLPERFKIRLNLILDRVRSMSPELAKVIKTVNISVLSDKDYFLAILDRKVEGIDLEDPRNKTLIEIFFNTSKAFYSEKDGIPTIYLKDTYLNSEDGEEYGMDLILEELAHAARSAKKIGALSSVDPQIKLLNQFQNLEDFIKSMGLAKHISYDTQGNLSFNNMFVWSHGFSYSLRNEEGVVLAIPMAFLTYEELRASILQVILEAIYYYTTNPSKSLTINKYANILEGIALIKERSKFADYSRELSAWAFIESLINAAESQNPKHKGKQSRRKNPIDVIEELILILMTYNLDEFFEWMKQSSRESFSGLYQTSSNYTRQYMES